VPINQITSCEVCGNSDLTSALELGDHPLCDDLVPIGDDRTCTQYPIEILFCSNCITAHQRYPVNKETLFPENYHYRARVTGSVLSGMRELAEGCLKRYGNLNGKLVLDIGCNDGSLLNFFHQEGARTVGIEPTGAADEANKVHTIIKRYFDAETAKSFATVFGHADIITFTNVFAHIGDLPALIANLKTIMGEETVLIIENHYLGDILSRGQFDTFYHEHPRTYSFRSFKKIAETLDRNLIDVEFVSRYGGNIRVHIGNSQANCPGPDESSFFEQFSILREEMEQWRRRYREKIFLLVSQYGPLPAKAFPGRAAILVKLLGLSEEHIAAVYEIKGSQKTGHYVPGTRIPILQERDLYRQGGTGPILNLAWHIPTEVRDNLRSNQYYGEIIDIR
jgi:SAM-dependent methyltransferase